MRGRVGRSNKKAFCYLLTPPLQVLTNEARQRLKAIEEFSDLGSGFNVAMRDLDIRGAGNLLGGEQSGFISEIGFEMYHKILDEAIQELKETEFTDLFREEIRERKFVSDCQIDTDLEILLPGEEKLDDFKNKLRDRFGEVPLPALELISTIRLRWVAEKLGFEKILLKNKRFIGHLVGNPASPFYQSEQFTAILKFVQANSNLCRMKQDQNKLTLTIRDISSVGQANKLLNRMLGIENVVSNS